MQNETVARRYATAVFSLAKERNAVERVGADLRAALAAIENDDAARRFFMSPVVDRSQKAGVFTKAFAAFDEVALHTVLLLVRKRREALLAPIVAEYSAMMLADSGRERLEVTGAREMNLVWAVRKAGLSLMTGRVGSAKPVAFIEDAAVRPAAQPTLQQDVRRTPDRRSRIARRRAHRDERSLDRRLARRPPR